MKRIGAAVAFVLVDDGHESDVHDLVGRSAATPRRLGSGVALTRRGTDANRIAPC
jgi:hypothetical protein